ncbi:MAG: SapC family protein [Roseinatronobacter sp.]
MPTAKPLFYQSVVPLDFNRHKALRISRPEHPLEFARNANVIPALVDEFELAIDDLPIAFLPGAKTPSAVFVTGAAPGTNAFVSDDGLWKGQYVPAYLRRYPFIIGDVSATESILCIDEAYAGLGEDEGECLFSETGGQEAPLAQALALAQGYRDAAVKTERFCAMLQEFGLLQEATLDTTAPDGTKSVVYGLLIVDEGALAGLPSDQLHALHQQGFLKAIYTQIVSLRSVDKLNPAAPVETASRTRESA